MMVHKRRGVGLLVAHGTVQTVERLAVRWRCLYTHGAGEQQAGRQQRFATGSRCEFYYLSQNAFLQVPPLRVPRASMCSAEFCGFQKKLCFKNLPDLTFQIVDYFAWSVEGHGGAFFDTIGRPLRKTGMIGIPRAG